MVLDGIFRDIGNYQGKNALGYPTQKPLALLERIIKQVANLAILSLTLSVGVQPPASPRKVYRGNGSVLI